MRAKLNISSLDLFEKEFVATTFDILLRNNIIKNYEMLTKDLHIDFKPL